jgi:hypothetical protein
LRKLSNGGFETCGHSRLLSLCSGRLGRVSAFHDDRSRAFDAWFVNCADLRNRDLVQDALHGFILLGGKLPFDLFPKVEYFEAPNSGLAVVALPFQFRDERFVLFPANGHFARNEPFAPVVGRGRQGGQFL